MKYEINLLLNIVMCYYYIKKKDKITQRSYVFPTACRTLKPLTYGR